MVCSIVSVGLCHVHLVHNERTKLTASWLNTLGTALFAAGGFAPMAALLYGISEMKLAAIYVVLLASLCAAGAILLHLVGRRFLRRLHE
jgi:hypothetical protein